jgi:hypothetical protein
MLQQRSARNTLTLSLTLAFLLSEINVSTLKIDPTQIDETHIDFTQLECWKDSVLSTPRCSIIKAARLWLF